MEVINRRMSDFPCNYEGTASGTTTKSSRTSPRQQPRKRHQSPSTRHKSQTRLRLTKTDRRRSSMDTPTSQEPGRLSVSSHLPPISRNDSASPLVASVLDGEGLHSSSANQSSSKTNKDSKQANRDLTSSLERRGSFSNLLGNQTPLLQNNNSSNSRTKSPDIGHQESHRLSPIHTFDKPKIKFEKKLMRSLTNDLPQLSPRQEKFDRPPQSGARSRITRRPSTKSVPKNTPTEEPFSIRKKIEQFRKWHEEQYQERLSILKAMRESTTKKTQPELDSQKNAKDNEFSTDYTKILESNIQSHSADDVETKNKDHEDAAEKDQNNIENNMKTDPKPENTKSRTSKEKVPERQPSAKTWKTWRGVNQSDAYDDVEKYIQDNDLLDDKRKAWINTWITNVKEAMDQGQVSMTPEN